MVWHGDILVDAGSLKPFFDPGSLTRGVDYFRRGRVESIDWDTDDQWVEATVAGSGRSAYFVSIELQRDRLGRLAAVDGSCSCPVGRNCKHAVAALLEATPIVGAAAIRQDGGLCLPETLSWKAKSWLDTLSQTDDPQDQNNYPDHVRDRLIYLIVRTDTGRLDVQPAKVRLLKSGAYSERWTRYDTAGTAQFLRPIDRMLLRQIEGLDRFSGLCDDILGQRIWEDILATGRAHFSTPAGPKLIPSDPRAGTFVWRALPDGRQALVAEDTQSNSLIPLPFCPPWYLCADSGATGLFETGLPERTAAALARAPILEATEAEAVSAVLVEQNQPNVPVPVQIERAEHRPIPIPVLRLTSADVVEIDRYGWSYRHSRIATQAPALSLQFDYGGHRLAGFWEDPALHIERTGPGRIDIYHRNHDSEATAIDRLGALAHAAGFVEPEDINGTISSDGPEPEFVIGPDESEHAQAMACAFQAEAVATLRAQGWVIEIDDRWPVTLIDASLKLSGSVFEGGSGDTALSLKLTGNAGDAEFDFVPLLREIILQLPPHILEHDDLAAAVADITFYPALPDGRRIGVPGRAIAPLVDAFRQLTGLTDLHFADSQNAWKLADSIEGMGGRFAGLNRLRALAQRLERLGDPKGVPLPSGLTADMRPYQRVGFGWLTALEQSGFGGVLADDMGLGKTLQALALLCARHAQTDKPSLVVLPTSLIGVWVNEAAKFTPNLRVLVLHGPDRVAKLDSIAEHDLILTTYALIRRDQAVLEQEYAIAICDEAQAVKNPRSATAKAVRRIKADMRLALTGTPVENNLEELWSIMDWCCPALLGTRTAFNETWRRPIERDGDRLVQKRLAARLRPFLLRRTKEDVAADLPPKSEIMEPVVLGPAQRALYDTIRVAMDKRVRDTLAAKGLAASRITVLDALLKMRLAVCDPALVKIEAARAITESAKRARLIEMLEPLIAEGRKVLIFSQFVTLLELIENDVEARGWRYTKLTGKTRKRAEAVDAFQTGAADIFLISLKAGGTGLTLTQADTVIITDPWWSPAAERQAMDRAHRIGQDKPVFVYRLIATGTIEERIIEMQSKKSTLANAIFDADSTGIKGLSEGDIMALFG